MNSASGIMAGKKGLIMGVANERSIAWNISKIAHQHGAELAFTYQGDALLKRITPLAESIGKTKFTPYQDITIMVAPRTVPKIKPKLLNQPA